MASGDQGLMGCHRLIAIDGLGVFFFPLLEKLSRSSSMTREAGVMGQRASGLVFLMLTKEKT
jgi:hypothetical protein